jgi:hypothetical protein
VRITTAVPDDLDQLLAFRIEAASWISKLGSDQWTRPYPSDRLLATIEAGKDHGLIPRCFTRGGSTSDATFRATSSSRTAAVSAVRSTRCASFAVAAVWAVWTRVMNRRTSATLSDSSRLVPSMGTR